MRAEELAAIIVSALAYSTETPYPYLYALLPVFGAVAVIVAGLTDRNTMVSAILANRAMVWIGLVSYSWYLWHWPLLAFARIARFGERHFWVDALAGVISLGLAAATYYLLERPIREWRQARRKSLGWAPVLIGVVVFAGASAGGLFGFQAVASRVADFTPPEYLPSRTPPNPYCDLNAAGASTTCNKLAAGRQIALLLGDSHAVSARNQLAAFAASEQTIIASSASGGCISLLGTKVFMPDKRMQRDCEAGRANALKAITRGDLKFSQAILFSRWPIYGIGPHYLGPADATQPADDQHAILVEELQRTVAYLKSQGVRRILVIGPLPFFLRPVPNCLFLADQHHMDRRQTCGVSRPTADAERQPSAKSILAAIDGLPDVRYVDPFSDFCDEAHCLPYSDKAILFTDTNHLSDAGTDRILAGHKADFDWLIAGASP